MIPSLPPKDFIVVEVGERIIGCARRNTAE